jgi:Family of unknown function (DUF6093)
MSLDALLARGRLARMRLMRDKVAITRVTGRTFNSATNTYLPTVVQVYSGVADVKPRDIGSVDVQAGDFEVVLRQFDIAFPWESAEARPDDVVTVTASDDATLVGRDLVVMSAARGGRRTARHLIAEERQ